MMSGLFLFSLIGNSLALYALMLGKGGLGKRRSKTIFLHITLADVLVTLFPMAGTLPEKVFSSASQMIFRPDNLGNYGKGVAGWLGLLQTVQVYPDLCLGLLQLHAGVPGGGQAQGSHQASHCHWISLQVKIFIYIHNMYLSVACYIDILAPFFQVNFHSLGHLIGTVTCLLLHL